MIKGTDKCWDGGRMAWCTQRVTSVPKSGSPSRKSPKNMQSKCWAPQPGKSQRKNVDEKSGKVIKNCQEKIRLFCNILDDVQSVHLISIFFQNIRVIN